MKTAVEKVQKTLDKLGYDGKIIHSDATIFTVEDASKAIGVSQNEILKSLIFLVDDAPWLVLMAGGNRVHAGKVKRLARGRRVTMAQPDLVFRRFGFKIGGVPPLGYTEALPALLDEDLWNFPVVWAAAGTDHDFFPVAPDDLCRFTKGIRGSLKKE